MPLARRGSQRADRRELMYRENARLRITNVFRCQPYTVQGRTLYPVSFTFEDAGMLSVIRQQVLCPTEESAKQFEQLLIDGAH